MMTCTKCGRKIKPDFSICFKCYEKLKMQNIIKAAIEKERADLMQRANQRVEIQPQTTLPPSTV
jgi:hypothetical protein